ncbi:MAG: hypothetical protein LLG42_16290 [Chloroflexi bacterium]|nr:hypothetical protein [Chloroflexota bacterium]
MSETRSGYNITTRQVKIETRRYMINPDTPMPVLRQEILNQLRFLEEAGWGNLQVKFKNNLITEIEVTVSYEE